MNIESIGSERIRNNIKINPLKPEQIPVNPEVKEQQTVNPNNYKQLAPDDILNNMNQAGVYNRIQVEKQKQKNYDLNQYNTPEQIKRIQSNMPKIEKTIDEVKQFGLSDKANDVVLSNIYNF